MAKTRTSSKVKDRYNAKAYDEIKVRVPKGNKEKLQAFVERHGLSVNGFINGLIDEAMKHERARDDGSSTGEQFPYFPDDEETPHAAVGVSPTQGEESTPAEQLFPDDWEEDEKDLPW